MARIKKVNAVFTQGELFAPEVYEESQKQLKQIYAAEFEAKKYVVPAEKVKTTEEEEREIFGDRTIWEHKGAMQKDFTALQADINRIEDQAKKERAAEEKAVKDAEEKKLNAEVLAARELIKDKLIRFENPKNENEKLFNLQYEFFNGDVNAWGKMILLSTKVCKQLVRHYMSERHRYIDETEQDEKASIAMEYVLRRFQKTAGYYCNTNFIKLLSDGVLHAMEYKTKEDFNACLENIKEESRFKRISY